MSSPSIGRGMLALRQKKEDVYPPGLVSYYSFISQTKSYKTGKK